MIMLIWLTNYFKEVTHYYNSDLYLIVKLYHSYLYSILICCSILSHLILYNHHLFYHCTLNLLYSLFLSILYTISPHNCSLLSSLIISSFSIINIYKLYLSFQTYQLLIYFHLSFCIWNSLDNELLKFLKNLSLRLLQR